jgi:hypothetical protein
MQPLLISQNQLREYTPVLLICATVYDAAMPPSTLERIPVRDSIELLSNALTSAVKTPIKAIHYQNQKNKKTPKCCAS